MQLRSSRNLWREHGLLLAHGTSYRIEGWVRSRYSILNFRGHETGAET